MKRKRGEEFFTTKIFVSKTRVGKKVYEQYKMNLPKEAVETIGAEKAEMFWDKKNNKITIIIKK